VSWARIDDRLHSHPKVLEAGPEAMGLFLLALSWCADYLTDGFVPEIQVKRLLFVCDDPLAIADRLVSAGLWERADGGYQIHDYLEYNPSAEQVKAERAANAKRQAEWRDRKRQRRDVVMAMRNNVSNNDSNGVTNNSPVPVPNPDPQEEPPTEGGDPPLPPTKTVEFDTPEARILKARLQATAKAKGRRGPKTFETLEQKRDFLAAVQVLGDEFGDLLHKAMREGCTSRARAVSYLVGCAKNKEKVRGSPVIGGEPAGFDGIRQWLEQKGAMAA
jgi:hypothetical protein